MQKVRSDLCWSQEHQFRIVLVESVKRTIPAPSGGGDGAFHAIFWGDASVAPTSCLPRRRSARSAGTTSASKPRWSPR